MMSKIGVVLAASSVWLLSSCRYSEAREPEVVPTKSETSPSKPDDEPAPASRADGPAESAAPAEGTSCEDQTCVGNEDCCKGYGCAFDPERSRVQRYCLKQ